MLLCRITPTQTGMQTFMIIAGYFESMQKALFQVIILPDFENIYNISPGALVFQHDMVVNIPLLADLQVLHTC